MQWSIDEWPPQVGVHLLECDTKDLLELAANHVEGRKQRVDDALDLTLPFASPRGRRFDPKRLACWAPPRQRHGDGGPGHGRPFCEHFPNWVDEGDSRKDVVLAFCAAAESKWRLGE